MGAVRTWVLEGAVLLVALGVFGRMVLQPIIRSVKGISELIAETRATHDDVWSMVDGFVDHERRIQRVETRLGINPGPMTPALSPIQTRQRPTNQGATS